MDWSLCSVLSVNMSPYAHLFLTTSMYDVWEILIWITSLNNKHQRQSYKQGINWDGTVKIFFYAQNDQVKLIFNLSNLMFWDKRACEESAERDLLTYQRAPPQWGPLRGCLRLRSASAGCSHRLSHGGTARSCHTCQRSHTLGTGERSTDIWDITWVKINNDGGNCLRL